MSDGTEASGASTTGVGQGDAEESIPGSGDGTGADTVLSVEDLRKSFDGLVAVDGASFDVERGTITGLVGPNGAGKTTTFNCITGMLPTDAGTVRFDGEDITGLEPHEVADRGLVRTFQIARELSEMTVMENLMLAPQDQYDEQVLPAIVPSLRERVRERERAMFEEAWKTLEFFEIDHLAREYAKNLSGGQRKLLGLARALMTEPEMVLLDEPFTGVNPSLERRLLGRIHDLRDEGYTFLMVEHDLDLIMEECETVIVMHQGKILAEGDPEEVTADERVVEAYLGGEV